MKNKKVVGPISLIVILSFILSGCDRSLVAPSKATSERTMGTITGKISRADGKPLVNVIGGDIGYVILICSGNNNSNGECLREEDMQRDVSEIVSSICDIGEISSNCKLHLMIGASKLGANGGYIFPAVFPGKYDLLLVVISNGIAVTIRLLNVEPVQAGKTVEFNFATK
jgi:hypothetical protein